MTGLDLLSLSPIDTADDESVAQARRLGSGKRTRVIAFSWISDLKGLKRKKRRGEGDKESY